jgi:hypothetical protein
MVYILLIFQMIEVFNILAFKKCLYSEISCEDAYRNICKSEFGGVFPTQIIPYIMPDVAKALAAKLHN